MAALAAILSTSPALPLCPYLPCPAGYLTLKEVFGYGALMAVVNLALWALLGSVWWKVIGLF